MVQIVSSRQRKNSFISSVLHSIVKTGTGNDVLSASSSSSSSSSRKVFSCRNKTPTRSIFILLTMFLPIVVFTTSLWWSTSLYPSGQKLNDNGYDLSSSSLSSPLTSTSPSHSHNKVSTNNQTDITKTISPASVITLSTMNINHENNEGNDNNNNNNNISNNNNNTNDGYAYEVCFVTSVYSSSVENADRPPSVKDIRHNNPTFQFFVFTNLSNLIAPGWEIIIKTFTTTDSNDVEEEEEENNGENNTDNDDNNKTKKERRQIYRRYITQSRWPKFMGWKHEKIKQCQAVFYMDGYCSPKLKHSERYKRLAKSIHEDYFGLYQNQHEMTTMYNQENNNNNNNNNNSNNNSKNNNKIFGPLEELDRIVLKKKDIARNVQASKDWLLSQPDFRPYNTTMYANHYIGYDPNNPNFQRAAQFFWDHYSLEEDSWRDQPLWSYVLDKFHITPKRLGTFEALFREQYKRMGHGGHRYNEKADDNAKANSTTH